MFKTAYETLACRSYDTQAISHALKLAMMEGEIQNAQAAARQMWVDGIKLVTPSNQDVPAFTHPFHIDDPNHHEAADPAPLFLDGRAYLRPNREGGFNYTNITDYRFQIMRAVFNLHWLKSPRDLFNLGDLAPLVFCRWLSGAVVKRLGLGPGEQVRVMTVTLFYWYSLFREADEDFTEKEKMRILSKLNQIASSPTTLSMDIVEDMYMMRDINDYVGLLRHVVGSTRMENFSPAFLFAALGGSWFGLNAKETIAVATEHPPTFVAIVQMALDDRSYRKSGLGQLVYTLDKRGRGEVFSNNSMSLIKQYLVE